jgi:hypothetical protein
MATAVDYELPVGNELLSMRAVCRAAKRSPAIAGLLAVSFRKNAR